VLALCDRRRQEGRGTPGPESPLQQKTEVRRVPRTGRSCAEVLADEVKNSGLKGGSKRRGLTKDPSRREGFHSSKEPGLITMDFTRSQNVREDHRKKRRLQHGNDDCSPCGGG